MEAPSVLRVLELYSGVGGMHCALQGSDIQYTVVTAVDINTTANHIYQSNFPQTTLISCGIEKLTIEQMQKWRVDLIVMSPPCQPFTRVGKKRDVDDVRAKSFLHVLHLVAELEVKPRYILVENVKGFEQSQARQNLINTLQSCAYVFQEFLLTPLQFGVPNSRLRYYLVAKRSPLMFSFPLSQEIQTELPPCCLKWLTHKDKSFNSFHDGSSDNTKSQFQETSVCHEQNQSKPSDKSNCDMQSMGSACRFTNDIYIDGVSSSQTVEIAHFGEAVTISDKAAQSKETSCSTKNVCAEHDHLDLITTQSDKMFCTTRNDSKVNDSKNNSNFNIKVHDDDMMIQKTSVICQKCNDSSSGHNSNPDSQICKYCGSGYVLSDVKTCDDVKVSGDVTSCTDAKASAHVGTNSDLKPDYEDCGDNLRLSGGGDLQRFPDCRNLEVFMERLSDTDLDRYLLGDKDLRMFVIMDIVHSKLRRSSCFTRRYGHYVDGAGPIVQMSTDIQAITAASELKSKAVDSDTKHSWGKDELKIIRDLKMRYFTPREIANLLCFPPHFVLPEDLSTIQLYRCLGNSLNVHVVSVLIRLMTDGDCQCSQ